MDKNTGTLEEVAYILINAKKKLVDIGRANIAINSIFNIMIIYMI